MAINTHHIAVVNSIRFCQRHKRLAGWESANPLGAASVIKARFAAVHSVLQDHRVDFVQIFLVSVCHGTTKVLFVVAGV